MLDVGGELLQLSKQAAAGGDDDAPGSGAGKAGTGSGPAAADPGSFLAVVGRSTGKWVQDGGGRVLMDDQWATNQSTTFLTAGKPGPAARSPGSGAR